MAFIRVIFGMEDCIMAFIVAIFFLADWHMAVIGAFFFLADCIMAFSWAFSFLKTCGSEIIFYIWGMRKGGKLGNAFSGGDSSRKIVRESLRRLTHESRIDAFNFYWRES